jgi:DNA polymerase-4
MIACLRLPPLALLAAWRANPELRGRPLVLGGLPGQQSTVIAASPEAAAFGVAAGMPLQQAEQHCPAASFQPVDDEGTAVIGRLVLRALYRFTPEVSEPAPDGSCFMGLDGSGLRWPDPVRLLNVVSGLVERAVGAPPAVGIGPNLFVCRLAADRADLGAPLKVEADRVLDFLCPLPVAVLPLEDDMRTYLDLLGLRTLGALRRISRVAWRRQFGVGALTVYDLALGIDPRPLPAWRPPPRITEAAPLDPPVENVEALQFVVRAACDRLGDRLLRYGAGARRVEVTLDQEGSLPLRLEASFLFPATAAADLFDGIRSRLRRAQFSAPVSRIAVRVRALEPAYVRQPGLLARRDAMREALAAAVARLQDEHRPELVQRVSLRTDAPALPGRCIEWAPA